MKQITIYELIPLLRNGWVAMEGNGNWFWYQLKPRVSKRYEIWKVSKGKFMKLNTIEIKDITPFDGDWKDSLIKCGESAIIKKHKEDEE